ncbi:ArsR/SmtB family transcription factor [Halomicrococcus gelatinilyticus]|uniref:ArsR/SmtB family transcription factor n=1 Tax=Halomicrococcus gelatinilyticus TaxID=1702103 RepID=UPI002E112627
MSPRPDEPRESDPLPPARAFSILGNELRVEILRTLASAELPEDPLGEPSGLSFSELYDRVDASNTSQFSYHLNELDDAFVRETDDGYRLTYAGQKIVRTILAGTYNERPGFEPVDLDGLCPGCGETTLRAARDEEMVVIRCTGCEAPLVSVLPSPAQGRNRTASEILQSTGRYVHQEYALAVDGVCSECKGRMRGRVEPGRDPADDTYVHVVQCEECDYRLTSPIELRLLSHPAVVSFYWSHGVDIGAKPLWELFEYLFSDRWRTTVLSTDPYEFRVTFAVDGNELRIEMDETLSVTSVRATETQVPRANEDASE